MNLDAVRQELIDNLAPVREAMGDLLTEMYYQDHDPAHEGTHLHIDHLKIVLFLLADEFGLDAYPDSLSDPSRPQMVYVLSSNWQSLTSRPLPAELERLARDPYNATLLGQINTFLGSSETSKSLFVGASARDATDRAHYVEIILEKDSASRSLRIRFRDSIQATHGFGENSPELMWQRRLLQTMCRGWHVNFTAESVDPQTAANCMIYAAANMLSEASGTRLSLTPAIVTSVRQRLAEFLKTGTLIVKTQDKPDDDLHPSRRLQRSTCHLPESLEEVNILDTATVLNRDIPRLMQQAESTNNRASKAILKQLRSILIYANNRFDPLDHVTQAGVSRLATILMDSVNELHSTSPNNSMLHSNMAVAAFTIDGLLQNDLIQSDFQDSLLKLKAVLGYIVKAITFGYCNIFQNSQRAYEARIAIDEIKADFQHSEI